jgi:hypothetical protein
MNSLLSCLVVAACLCAGTLAVAADEQKAGTPDEAKAVALAWLKLVDEGKFDQSWKEAASYFQAMVPAQSWLNAMQQSRAPLGAAKTREFKSATFTHDLPRAPKGDYWVIQFATSFEGTEAIETITPMLDKDGKWHVSGYYIKRAQ